MHKTAEFHVSKKGNDANTGTPEAPFATIQRAAERAQPGDTVTVHAGVYREYVNPPRAGLSDSKRITYQAAPGESVEIKGSEVVKGWVKVRNDTWKATLPNTFFGRFNPYQDVIWGDWFRPCGRRTLHTGAVYLNGEWLMEAADAGVVLRRVSDTPCWFARVDERNTTLWAQFPETDPNAAEVEINVRRSVFYPDQPGRNFITVRGFVMSQAATPWAPPTAEQVGLIGTHWSKGWIIENNIIRHSICSGISLGKYGDEFDNNTSKAKNDPDLVPDYLDGTKAYNKTIERALARGWNQETIGSHIVCNNDISHCEQAGIVGSLGAVFSTITGNTIHDIHERRLFGGCEQAGIKIHAAIDTVISHNHIFRCNRGVWLDWMAQGAQVVHNLFHDNASEKINWIEHWEANAASGEQDIYLEVNHGPILVANNIFLSPYSINSRSQGVAFVHNLIAGAMRIVERDGRRTPWHEPHSTNVRGLKGHPMGDNRYYNNLFVRHADLRNYDRATLPLWMEGNVFVQGAVPSMHETHPLVLREFNPAVQLTEKPDGWWLDITLGKDWSTQRTRTMVTSERLGKVAIPNTGYEGSDGSPLCINTDYLGKPRNEANPMAGPFEIPEAGKLTLKVFGHRWHSSSIPPARPVRCGGWRGRSNREFASHSGQRIKE